jgi:hypothetical protein
MRIRLSITSLSYRKIDLESVFYQINYISSLYKSKWVQKKLTSQK